MLFRSLRWSLPAVLAGLALSLAPPVLMLIVVAAKFQGLGDALALDHAQLARHLARGDGWVTSFVRPLCLTFHAALRPAPDLTSAPLHPLFLALAFRFFAATDRVVAGAGAALWVLSVWLTFAAARSWFGVR